MRIPKLFFYFMFGDDATSDENGVQQDKIPPL